MAPTQQWRSRAAVDRKGESLRETSLMLLGKPATVLLLEPLVNMLLKDVGRRKVLSQLALNVPHAVDDARDDLRVIRCMKKGGQSSGNYAIPLSDRIRFIA